MSTDDQDDPERPRRIADTAASLSKFLKERQKEHAEHTRDLGYASDSLKDVAAIYYGRLPDHPLLAGTERSLKKFNELARAREGEFTKLRYELPLLAFGTTLTSTSAATIVAFPGAHWQELESAKPPPRWTKDRVYEYAEKLARLDPELRKLARGVWQTFYGGSDSDGRESLGLMRQLFDHFFAVLAPDEHVRASPFFTEKADPDPQQVHRAERLGFAASRISDLVRRDLLLSQAQDVLDQYQELNLLHKRGPIDREVNSRVLQSMEAILEEWIDALEAGKTQSEA